MTNDESTKAVATAVGASLLGEGKSSRLQEMRRKALGLEREPPQPPQSKAEENGVADDEALLRARQLIDRRLAEILARFPASKKQRFFSIRYGMTPERLKQQSIGRIFAVLGLEVLRPSDMKRIADLDYNGRPISKRDGK